MSLPFRDPTHHSGWQACASGRDLAPAEVCLVECMAAAVCLAYDHAASAIAAGEHRAGGAR